MRLIDPIRLKQALAISAILEDKKTIEQIIDEQPTIEPERKTGKWICEPHPNWGKWGIYIAKCSECGFSYGAWKWNFCPNCGARMEEQNE